MTTRRSVLALAAIPLAGCAVAEKAAPQRSPSPVPATTPATTPATPARHDRLVDLERTSGARLGVYALDTADGRTITHRADERFAFCSTFKGLAAAAVLARRQPLDERIAYTAGDLMRHAPITRRNVARGMTIAQLCDAAVRYSDGTAGNLLVRELGGPGRLTAYLRGLGDTVTRMDRIEPDITSAVPGDPRDTTSPRAIGTDYQRVVLGDVLPADRRAVLIDLLKRNTTGDRRVRAGVPRGWVVADKTGTGSYGTANDIAVLWPPGRPPVVLAVMSSKSSADAGADEALLAEATAYVVESFAKTGR